MFLSPLCNEFHVPSFLCLPFRFAHALRAFGRCTSNIPSKPQVVLFEVETSFERRLVVFVVNRLSQLNPRATHVIVRDYELKMILCRNVNQKVLEGNLDESG